SSHGRRREAHLQVEGDGHGRDLLLHVHDAGNLRLFLFSPPPHEGENCRHVSAFAQALPSRDVLAAHPKRSTSRSAEDREMIETDQREAERFRRLALPLLDEVYTFARYLTRDAAEAEDAAQETYLRALRYFSGFSGESIKPWLFTILRNVL